MAVRTRKLKWTFLGQHGTGTAMFEGGAGDLRYPIPAVIAVRPDRVDFDPFPYESFAIWILTQMKRWGQIKGEVDYQSVAREVFLATDTAKLMTADEYEAYLKKEQAH